MSEKKRVLIVEDEMVISMELAATLQRLGYETSGQVITGSDALSHAEQFRPDLVLMDIRLQGEMDGIEAADRIKAAYDIPVVFLTAHSDETTLQRAIAVQPSGYLIKPFRDRELYSTIELSLHKQELRRRLRPQVEVPLILTGELPKSVPLLLMNRNWIISGATERAEAILHVEPGELSGSCLESWVDILPGEEGEAIMPESLRMKTGDGDFILVTLTLGLVKGPHDRITGYLVEISRRDTPA
ncbi:MAG: response regulator [Methanospirillum sp.]|nr:response regulator [Methanospirillum sp.]